MKKLVEVRQTVEITVDETKFTPEFMAEFRSSFYNFHTVNDHIEHLAQLYARGIADDLPHSFIEGYGPPPEMGIKFENRADDLSSEIVDEPAGASR